MAGFYYTRQNGPDGQILCGEGDCEGVPLDDLLRRERPSLRAALELGAAVGDILCIAGEDGAIHGELAPGWVAVDEYGDVSVYGFGVARGGGRAPEGRGDVLSADLFGLGLVVFEAIAGGALPALPKNADGHDDAVVDQVLALDFSKVKARKWLDEVQRFLARLLAWSPTDRPAPLDAANVLGSVAAQVPDEGLADWAKRVLTKPKPGTPMIPEAVPLRAMPEILDQPLSLTAPFKPGGVRKAPAAKGESTNFWSRDRIAQMLADEDAEDLPPARPASMPRPQERMSAEVELTRSTQERFREPKMEAARAVEPPRPAEPSRPRLPESPPPVANAAPRSEPEPARPSRAAAVAPPVPEPDEPEPKKGGGMMIFAGGAFFVFLLVCGGLTLAGGGGYWWWASQKGTTTTTTEEPAKTEATEPAKVEEPAAEPTPAEAPKKVEAPKAEAPKKVEPAKTTTTTKTTATPAPKTTPPATTPAPKTTTTTTTVTQPVFENFTVRFSVPGKEGKIVCGDGQVSRFSGSATLSFKSTTACRVEVGSARAGVQVSKNASVTCSETAGGLSCSGA